MEAKFWREKRKKRNKYITKILNHIIATGMLLLICLVLLLVVFLENYYPSIVVYLLCSIGLLVPYLMLYYCVKKYLGSDWRKDY